MTCPILFILPHPTQEGLRSFPDFYSSVLPEEIHVVVLLRNDQRYRTCLSSSGEVENGGHLVAGVPRKTIGL